MPGNVDYERRAAVEIAAYSDKWPEMFAAEAQIIRAAFELDDTVHIEHIGSTAVPGMGAKPIIDIRTARFHVHAVESAARFWRDHIAFRDVLRTNREVFAAYLSLKQDLAQSLKMDRAAYTEAKAPFIRAVLDAYAAQM